MAYKFSENATVLVAVINVNDNAPKFERSSYDYELEGKINAGTTIAVIAVR